MIIKLHKLRKRKKIKIGGKTYSVMYLADFQGIDPDECMCITTPSLLTCDQRAQIWHNYKKFCPKAKGVLILEAGAQIRNIEVINGKKEKA